MNRTRLERQLLEAGLSVERAPSPAEWAEFLGIVDFAYRDADQERYTLDRAVAESYEELAAHRDQLRAVLDSMGDGLCVVDKNGRLESLNHAAEEILGWTQDAVYGDHVADVVTGYRAQGVDAAPDVAKLRQSLSEGLRSRDDDCRWLARDGSSVHVAWMLTPMVEHGEHSGSVLVFRDVGAYRSTVTELQHSEARFRTAFESTAIGMLRLGAVGHIVECNRALQRILGFNPAERVQRLPDIVHADDRDRVRTVLNELFSGARDHSRSEQRLVREDGSSVWCSLSMAPVVSPDGKRVVAIGTLEDLTELKSLEVELRQAQKLEAVGLLASGIAHEINTPVQFVGDNVQFLEGAFADLLAVVEAAKLPPDENIGFLIQEVPRAITETLEGVQRVGSIVRALKSFALPMGSQEQVATDLNQALANTLTVARNEFKYVADIETEFGELPLVRCHPGNVNQVFLNLIINAAHAIGDVHKKTGKRGVIRLRTSALGDRVAIAISDDGPGIKPEIRTKIFDPFFTTKPVGKGTGHGLAIVRSVVDKHGGAIRLDSELGRGTTFTIELPVHGLSDERSVQA
jgi:two-component system NtrC family sensor kinase